MPRMCTVVTVRDPSLGYVRVMTTHLEFYSKVQRTAQAHALVALNLQYIAQALAPPELCESWSSSRSAHRYRTTFSQRSFGRISTSSNLVNTKIHLKAITITRKKDEFFVTDCQIRFHTRIFLRLSTIETVCDFRQTGDEIR